LTEVEGPSPDHFKNFSDDVNNQKNVEDINTWIFKPALKDVLIHCFANVFQLIWTFRLIVTSENDKRGSKSNISTQYIFDYAALQKKSFFTLQAILDAIVIQRAVRDVHANKFLHRPIGFVTITRMAMC
jgi:hypothetical protein